jgi:predicted HicB family RNase H-like nuclease
MSTLEYKGYHGSIEIDLESSILHGKILFVTDLVTYEGTSVSDVETEFQSAVDDYLETCQQLGRDPQQPFSGLFNVRVGPTLHRNAAMRAYRDGVKLNAVVVTALEQYLAGNTVKHSHTHEHKVTVHMNETKSLGPFTYGEAQALTQQLEMSTNVHH